MGPSVVGSAAPLFGLHNLLKLVSVWTLAVGLWDPRMIHIATSPWTSSISLARAQFKHPLFYQSSYYLVCYAVLEEGKNMKSVSEPLGLSFGSAPEKQIILFSTHHMSRQISTHMLPYYRSAPRGHKSLLPDRYSTTIGIKEETSYISRDESFALRKLIRHLH